MKLLALLLTFISFSAIAQSLPNMQEAIAYDLNIILNETVNVGGRSVQVKRLNGRSAMNCSLASTESPEVSLAKCSVSFSGKLKACETSCFIIYTVEKKELTQLTRDEALVETCMADLSQSDC